MDSLHKFCQRNNRSNFNLITRFRFEGVNERKWDKQFLEEELVTSGKFDLDDISRVWVCGPPSMNQTFDQAFDELRQTYGSRFLSADKIDIM